jgi:rubrerythrin
LTCKTNGCTIFKVSRNTKEVYMAKKLPNSCPSCGAYDSFKMTGEENSRVDGKKAIIGAALLGPVGLIGGAFGKKKVSYVCSKCGYTVVL